MATRYRQQLFPFIDSGPHSEHGESVGAITSNDNAVRLEDKAFHDWYRFVLSFPPHLVRDYIRDFGLNEDSMILDPFCGTGTTIVEARLNRIASVGIEANPFPHFASKVKTNWSADPSELEELAARVSDATYSTLLEQGIDDNRLSNTVDTELWTLTPEAERALIKNSISPLPLHKSLVLLEKLGTHKHSTVYDYGVLALGHALVTAIGNLRFGPEVGVGKRKLDVPVVAAWNQEIQKMVRDLQTVRGEDYPAAEALLADARALNEKVAPCSIDAVITSPPYPNEKDYTRTTRLESVVLGFFTDMTQLRTHKKRLLRSNTRGVYKLDDDDKWVDDNPRIQSLAAQIEQRRIDMGKTSGFEKLYARVTKLYFGGMARHLHDIAAVLRPGARLAYVVGDQASYLQVLIRTGEIICEIAEGLGYEVERVDLFRTRFATATQAELREEVLVLHWPGHKRNR